MKYAKMLQELRASAAAAEQVQATNEPNKSKVLFQ